MNITLRNILFVALILVLGLPTFTHAQRDYQTVFVSGEFIIDGELNEEAWKSVEFAEDFTVQKPVYGAMSRYKSKFKILYDNGFIYLSGELHDHRPDSISYTLSSRDKKGNADWISISIDTYGNYLNGFSFGLTAAGVQLDALESSSDLDYSWNAVWKSAVKKQSYGWSFEMKIPYSSIRFPNKDVQSWNINFYRGVRRVRETSTWSPIDPQRFGKITQAGKLLGLKNIESPLRLSFTPYLTGYLENSFDYELNRQTWKDRLTGGLDLKLGLNDAFTLDMTLIPDFGQTTSDKQILNLGPFEVRFNENRPFFIEGTELFRIGGVFYSRRIGGRPFNYSEAYNSLNNGEQVETNPVEAPMLNGTKVSGRTKNGLGIGVFNAIEGNTFAQLVDSLGNRRSVETNPLTNYNVFVLSQNLRNNSTVSFVNTNVMRDGSNRDANVSVLTSSIYSDDGQYNVRSHVKLSSIFERETSEYGHAMGASVSKVAGTWRYGISYSEESDTYDPNDLGFLYNNNSRTYSAHISWNDFESSKYFFSRSINLSWYYEELYKPQLYNYSRFNFKLGGLHKKQVYMNLSGNVAPFGTVNHFESRNFGKEVYYFPSANVGYFFTTDYSKVFALDGRIGGTNYFGVEQYNWSSSLSPRVRISDQWNIVLNFSYNYRSNDYGYVFAYDDAYSDDIILGTRDRQIVENTIRTEFIFTETMGVDLRLRHYWQQVEYNEFTELLDEGERIETDYNPLSDDGESLHNTSYNAFTVDINYRWVFLPGSELRIVYKNNLFHSKSILDSSYFGTFETLFDQPQLNSISLKALFFIDALYFKRKKKK